MHAINDNKKLTRLEACWNLQEAMSVQARNILDSLMPDLSCTMSVVTPEDKIKLCERAIFLSGTIAC